MGKSGCGEEFVAYIAELLSEFCVMDLRCSRVDDTDIATAIMAFDSREGACLVPIGAVADAAHPMHAGDHRQFLPKYVDVGDFQGDVNRTDIARVSVEPPRCAG